MHREHELEVPLYKTKCEECPVELCDRVALKLTVLATLLHIYSTPLHHSPTLPLCKALPQGKE